MSDADSQKRILNELHIYRLPCIQVPRIKCKTKVTTSSSRLQPRIISWTDVAEALPRSLWLNVVLCALRLCQLAPLCSIANRSIDFPSQSFKARSAKLSRQPSIARPIIGLPCVIPDNHTKYIAQGLLRPSTENPTQSSGVVFMATMAADAPQDAGPNQADRLGCAV